MLYIPRELRLDDYLSFLLRTFSGRKLVEMARVSAGRVHFATMDMKETQSTDRKSVTGLIVSYSHLQTFDATGVALRRLSDA